MTPSSVTPHVAQPWCAAVVNPLHRGGAMLVFGYKQGDEDVHVEKTNDGRTLVGTAVGETTHVLG